MTHVKLWPSCWNTWYCFMVCNKELRIIHKCYQQNVYKSYMFIYKVSKKKVKLSPFSWGWPKGSFSIATTLRSREGHYSFPLIAHFTLDPYLIMLSVKQGSIKYHFLSLWYDSTWEIYIYIYIWKKIMDSNPTICEEKLTTSNPKKNPDLYDLNFVENEEWFKISRWTNGTWIMHNVSNIRWLILKKQTLIHWLNGQFFLS